MTDTGKNYNEIACYLCNGKGFLFNEGNTTNAKRCNFCNGKGYFTIEVTQINWIGTITYERI